MLSRGRAFGGEVGSLERGVSGPAGAAVFQRLYTLNTIASSRRMRGNQNHLWFGL